MSYQATVFRILIGGPGDTSEFKDIAYRIVHEWNASHSLARKIVLMPVRWELDSRPSYGSHPQSIINSQLVDNCDAMIAVFRDRLGSPTESNVSGTVEELERIHDAGKEVLVYMYNGPPDRRQAASDSFKKLEDFTEQARKRGLLEPFGTTIQLENRMINHLAQLGNKFADSTPLQTVSVISPQGGLAAIRSAAGRSRRLWQSEKDSNPPGVLDGKAVLATLKNDLASVDSGDNEETEAALQEISSRIARLQRHQLYADGGKSYLEFWEGGDEIFGSLDSLMDQLKNPVEADWRVPLASAYQDVQMSARLDFMPTGPYHYDLELIRMNFLATNHGQYSAKAIQFDLESDSSSGFLRYPRNPLPPGGQMTIEFSFPRGDRIDGEDQPKNEVHPIVVRYEDGIGAHSVGLSLSITGTAPKLDFEFTNAGVGE